MSTEENAAIITPQRSQSPVGDTEVNAVITPQRSLSYVEDGEAAIAEEETVVTREPSLSQESGDEMVDDVRNEDSGTPDITATPTKQTEDIAQGNTSQEKTLEPMPNQNGLGNESNGEKESSEDNNRKRKREENLSSTANVEETRANDTTTIDFPFEKKLPIWKTFESMEAFKTFTQTPHFSILMETQEDYREMSAVGMMYTYSASLEQVKTLQLLNAKSTLNSLKDSFAALEKHGFDVEEPQSRIRKLSSFIEWQAKKMEELKGVEKEIAEKESKKDETEQKIMELERMKEEANKEIDQMKSRVAWLEQELEDVELQF